MEYVKGRRGARNGGREEEGQGGRYEDRDVDAGGLDWVARGQEMSDARGAAARTVPREEGEGRKIQDHGDEGRHRRLPLQRVRMWRYGVSGYRIHPRSVSSRLDFETLFCNAFPPSTHSSSLPPREHHDWDVHRARCHPCLELPCQYLELDLIQARVTSSPLLSVSEWYLTRSLVCTGTDEGRIDVGRDTGGSLPYTARLRAFIARLDRLLLGLDTLPSFPLTLLQAYSIFTLLSAVSNISRLSLAALAERHTHRAPHAALGLESSLPPSSGACTSIPSARSGTLHRRHRLALCAIRALIEGARVYIRDTRTLGGGRERLGR
ncbi:hypothetical protein C8R45DRAFT_146035 [Mycena sanguinolenta]|nr:hypothetical protein C8R45DRAFT_146035 [Mycena sanguinolenta]